MSFEPINGFQACLHESAHAVICEHLAGEVHCVEAREMDGRGFGLTAAKNPRIPFHAAIVAAAGPAGAEMLGHIPQPDIDRESIPVLGDDGQFTTAAELPHGLFLVAPAVDAVPRLNRSDDERVAEFCVKGVADAPEVWQERYANVHAEARRLVALHADAITALAHRLWIRVVVARAEFLETINPYLETENANDR